MIGTFVMKELIRLTSERLRGVFNVHLKNIVHIDRMFLLKIMKNYSLKWKTHLTAHLYLGLVATFHI